MWYYSFQFRLIRWNLYYFANRLVWRISGIYSSPWVDCGYIVVRFQRAIGWWLRKWTRTHHVKLWTGWTTAYPWLLFYAEKCKIFYVRFIMNLAFCQLTKCILSPIIALYSCNAAAIMAMKIGPNCPDRCRCHVPVAVTQSTVMFKMKHKSIVMDAMTQWPN